MIYSLSKYIIDITGMKTAAAGVAGVAGQCAAASSSAARWPGQCAGPRASGLSARPNAQQTDGAWGRRCAYGRAGSSAWAWRRIGGLECVHGGQHTGGPASGHAGG